MSIPESQFETWSAQGATAGSQRVYASVRDALLANSSNVRHYSPDIFLQGSYRNSTNIRADSDVDVVCCISETYLPDTTYLSATERIAYDASHVPATYTWDRFRGDVLAALVAYFGQGNIENGNKCIIVARDSTRLTCDVVPSLEFRQFNRFRSSSDYTATPGIVFWTKNGAVRIVNWPKQHYENGVTKQAATSEWFKPTVRLFKNARTYMVDHGLLDADVAPSYFIQCALWNVPASEFGGRYTTTVWKCVKHLLTADHAKMLCENGIVPLFGETNQQWSVSKMVKFTKALLDLDTNWRA